MIYSYYCVDCGRKLDGGNIAFNLSRMLGLERKMETQSTADGVKQSVYLKDNFNDPFTLYISGKDLYSYARNSGIIQLENKKTVRIKITLRDVMELFAEKARDKNIQEEILNMGMNDIGDGKFVLDLSGSSGQNEAALQKEAGVFGKRLRMIFDKYAENDKEKEAHYKEILISPEFIDSMSAPESFYTLRYSSNPLNEGKLENFFYEGDKIRGYCPYCHAPVLRGTGKYRHRLVGFIGGSRAGKTSLIIAMLVELMNNPKSGFPKVVELTDSRIKYRKRQKTLYQKGWKIEKTQPQSVRDSFNVSIWVENQNRKGEYVVLTLADIAGELCLNSDEKFDRDAIKNYPLIDQCNLYLLCTCISDAGFRVDGGKGGIENGISTIVDGIEESFSERNECFPPVGIVLTKADYVESVEKAEPVKENPFRDDNIVRQDKYFSKGTEMLTRLGKIYDMHHDDSDYSRPLSWAGKLFQDYRKKTYLSILYCSATGRNAEIYSGDAVALAEIPYYTDARGNRLNFKAANVDVLLWWILQVIGCVPVKGSEGYCCYDIPMYGEGFASDKFKESNRQIRQEWPWEEWKMRNDAVYRLFLNQSELDVSLADIITKIQEDGPIIHFFKKLFGFSEKRQSLKAVEKYLNGK